MKELYRSAFLIFVFIVLIVLEKVTSATQPAEAESAFPQRALVEYPESPYLPSYRESYLHFLQGQGTPMYDEIRSGQKSLPVENRDADVTDWRDDLILDVGDHGELYADKGGF